MITSPRLHQVICLITNERPASPSWDVALNIRQSPMPDRIRLSTTSCHSNVTECVRANLDSRNAISPAYSSESPGSGTP